MTPRQIRCAGHCLCGAVGYQVEGELAFVANCHCSICRRSHGALMATQAVIFAPQLRWTSGEGALASFESTPGFFRQFCRHCGSRLMNHPVDHGFISLAVASLDELDAAFLPSVHVYVESKPAEVNICDALPQFATLPGAP